MAAVGLSLIVAALHRVPAMSAALAAAVLAVAAARLTPAVVLRRLLPLEALLLMVVLLLPANSLPHNGWLAAVIVLKANALVLGWLALAGTMDATTLGHALAHLHVPQKLAHLLLFTIRYLDVLHREYRRLRAAMRVRSFRPRMNLHTYRSFGYLVGMLLVRSLDRSERILGAMKCRGFRGRFYMLDHFAFSPRRDGPFCAAAAAVGAVLVFLEWQ